MVRKLRANPHSCLVQSFEEKRKLKQESNADLRMEVMFKCVIVLSPLRHENEKSK